MGQVRSYGWKSKCTPRGLALVSLAALGLLILWVVMSDGAVTFESRESKTLDGGPVFNRVRWLRRGTKDIWLMDQSHMGAAAPLSTWDHLAIVVDRSVKPKTARYYQLASGVLASGALVRSQGVTEIPPRVACFMCHANGPRLIRPELASSFASLSLMDRAKVAMMNVVIKSYGRVVLSAEHERLDAKAAKPVRFRGAIDNEPLKLHACVRCHNEHGARGREPLLRQHALTISFMVGAGLMPPSGKPLSPEEKQELDDFLAGF